MTQLNVLKKDEAAILNPASNKKKRTGEDQLISGQKRIINGFGLTQRVELIFVIFLPLSGVRVI